LLRLGKPFGLVGCQALVPRPHTMASGDQDLGAMPLTRRTSVTAADPDPADDATLALQARWERDLRATAQGVRNPLLRLGKPFGLIGCQALVPRPHAMASGDQTLGAMPLARRTSVTAAEPDPADDATLAFQARWEGATFAQLLKG
jgi:hypothetical protein